MLASVWDATWPIGSARYVAPAPYLRASLSATLNIVLRQARTACCSCSSWRPPPASPRGARGPSRTSSRTPASSCPMSFLAVALRVARERPVVEVHEDQFHAPLGHHVCCAGGSMPPERRTMPFRDHRGALGAPPLPPRPQAAHFGSLTTLIFWSQDIQKIKVVKDPKCAACGRGGRGGAPKAPR